MTEGERPAELASRMFEIVQRMNSAIGRNQDGSLTPYGDALAAELQSTCDAMLTADGARPADIMALLWFITRNSEAFLIGVVQDRVDAVAATRMKLGLDKLAGMLQGHFQTRPGDYIGAPPPDQRLN